MNISGNQILVTGGATGVGLALAEAFLKAGNQVAVCGRRQDKLDEVRQALPGIKTIQADVATAEGRSMLILQAFTQSLRFQLKGSSVKVFEVLPPAVNTALNQTNDPKISPQQVAIETLQGLEKGMSEIKVGQSKTLAMLARLSPSLAYSMINGKA